MVGSADANSPAVSLGSSGVEMGCSVVTEWYVVLCALTRFFELQNLDVAEEFGTLTLRSNPV